MREDLGLGRIAGIRIGMNWSLLVVFWLIAWSLAESILPSAAPGYSTSAYWIAGIASAVAFFASLLVHELGHAVVARRKGVQVDGITLWLFGGVSRLTGEAHTPTSEFRIAAIGPAISLGIAAISAVLFAALDYLGAPALVSHGVSWLGWINLILAGFNLVPAFPLDGGRVLRAVLWERLQDRLRATVWAARGGRAFGYVLIAVGLIEFATTTEIVNGLWSVFLGWFLLGAASSEEAHVLLRNAFDGVKVSQVMSPELVIAPGWITVDRFIHDYAVLHLLPVYPVRNFDGSLFGLVTWTHLRSVSGEDRTVTRVRDVATPLENAAVGRPEELLIALLDRMSERQEEYALVQDGQSVVGMVGPDDITRALRRAALTGAPVPEGSIAA